MVRPVLGTVHKTLKSLFCLIAFSLVFAFAMARNARANLVQDGEFTGVTYSGTLALSSTEYGQFGTGTGSTLTVANWTTTGYNFVYAPNTVDEGGTGGALAGEPKEAPGQYNGSNGYGNTYMWGPANGSANGMPSTDPAGGNFIAMDGTYERGAVSQVITGLTPTQVYVLKFYWAGAQQQSYTTATTETMAVSLGATTQMTGTASIPGEGFSGWTSGTMYFTATSATETLSFLASGTPNGQPPFTLLGGVDLEVIPDFSNWMVFAGFGTACVVFEGARRRRRRRSEITPVA
jgi:hypothetical protein